MKYLRTHLQQSLLKYIDRLVVAYIRRRIHAHGMESTFFVHANETLEQAVRDHYGDAITRLKAENVKHVEKQRQREAARAFENINRVENQPVQ